jgi:RHS repeat-associated protein
MRAIVPPDAGSYSYAGMSYANPHVVTSVGGTAYTYDNNGNVTAIGSLDYAWDWRNRLASAERRAGGITSYGYDHTGQRVFQSTGSATTSYPNRYYNVASSSLTATTTKHIFSPAGTLLAVVVGSGTSTASTTYLHPDHLGGTNVATDESGEVVQTLDYYPYGSQRIASGTFDEQRKFAGHEYDAESDLTYSNARYYEHDIGRWMSQDPRDGDITNPQSLNTYAYSLNNPIKYLDPNGEVAVLFSGLSNSTADMYAIRQMALSAAANQGLQPPDIRVFYHYQGKMAGNFVMNALASNPQEPIVIAGHSWGGDSAYNLAEALGERGIGVDSLIQVESVGFFDEGALENVRRRCNFSTRGFDLNFHGADSMKGAGSNNYNLSNLTHTNIDQTPLVRQTITREIVEAHREQQRSAIYDFFMNPLTPFGALANFWAQSHHVGENGIINKIRYVMTFNETIESFTMCLSIPSNIRICSTLINLSSRWRRLCGLSRERCVSRPGREATDHLLPRLANRFFVRAVRLPDRAKPDTVPEQFLLEVLCNRR